MPTDKGVYFAVNVRGEILYIGMGAGAYGLRGRWQTHEKRRNSDFMKRFSKLYFRILIDATVEQIKSYENQFLEVIAPPYNSYDKWKATKLIFKYVPTHLQEVVMTQAERDVEDIKAAVIRVVEALGESDDENRPERADAYSAFVDENIRDVRCYQLSFPRDPYIACLSHLCEVERLIAAEQTESVFTLLASARNAAIDYKKQLIDKQAQRGKSHLEGQTRERLFAGLFIDVEEYE
ncbi:GIY-YIG nuclease family protein [Pseudanabaenaceae cyanobacterium LEGE 13415]|nr:GIY-YIG nuclease family protein [Pseudanabaenaceae cyanobacterium LEGE 13415]